MAKKRPIGLLAAVISILTMLGLLGWFLMIIFESEKPQIQMAALPKFFKGKQEVALTLSDARRGIRRVEVYVKQAGRAIPLLEETFPFRGVLNEKGTHRSEIRLTMDPFEMNLAQGHADLCVSVWDYSRRNGGEGNLALLERRMMVDTIPPAIRAVSDQNYVNVGGSGLVIYHTSSDAIHSGLFVGEISFPGFPAGGLAGEKLHVCYFGIPLGLKGKPEIYLWAEDEAGNASRGILHCHVRQKRFRTDKMTITDRFLEQILPCFGSYLENAAGQGIDHFLKINRGLRHENAKTFQELAKQTSLTRLWEGDWLRLKNAANMARFGDRRIYFYKGEKVDEQIHMGVDLASLAQSEVQAANSGRVIFAEDLGIYGLTVILDHGQGLASTYSHLSGIQIQKGQIVNKGDVIGTTGRTGLALGDHLHFGVMVNGLFVNPIEWWDSHWIGDNIANKLSIIKN